MSLYDNVDSDGNTTTVADPDAPKWDSNGDGMMFVDSIQQRGRRPPPHPHPCRAAEVGAHLPLQLGSVGVDMSTATDRASEIKIEDGTPPVYFDVHDAEHKGIDPQDGVQQTGTSTNWDEVFAGALVRPSRKSPRA